MVSLIREWMRDFDQCLNLTRYRQLDFTVALCVAYQNDTLSYLIDTQLLRQVLTSTITLFGDLSLISVRYKERYSMLQRVYQRVLG